jgi:universal stress protein A
MNAAIRKIVVPVDFSEPSERAVEYAAALARSLGASLHLIHALEPAALALGGFELDGGPSAERLDDVYWTARTRLSVLSQKLALPAATSREVRPGHPSKVISTVVTDLGADLVVMSTHGRTGVSHLLMGSVAEDVMRSARCPVLMIRDAGRIALQPLVFEPVESAEMASAG